MLVKIDNESLSNMENSDKKRFNNICSNGIKVLSGELKYQKNEYIIKNNNYSYFYQCNKEDDFFCWFDSDVTLHLNKMIPYSIFPYTVTKDGSVLSYGFAMCMKNIYYIIKYFNSKYNERTITVRNRLFNSDIKFRNYKLFYYDYFICYYDKVSENFPFVDDYCLIDKELDLSEIEEGKDLLKIEMEFRIILYNYHKYLYDEIDKFLDTNRFDEDKKEFFLYQINKHKSAIQYLKEITDMFIVKLNDFIKDDITEFKNKVDSSLKVKNDLTLYNVEIKGFKTQTNFYDFFLFFKHENYMFLLKFIYTSYPLEYLYMIKDDTCYKLTNRQFKSYWVNCELGKSYYKVCIPAFGDVSDIIIIIRIESPFKSVELN